MEEAVLDSQRLQDAVHQALSSELNVSGSLSPRTCFASGDAKPDLEQPWPGAGIVAQARELDAKKESCYLELETARREAEAWRRR